MRRKRRSRGTWLPTFGIANTGVPGAQGHVQGIEFTLTAVAAEIRTIIVPITADQPIEGDAIAPDIDTLVDVVGQEYVLQRIVGKIHAVRRSTLVETVRDDNPAVLLGCGFFVARANDSASGGGAITPIGSATEAERSDNYSPLETDTSREPWIWRRTWVLGTNGVQGIAVNSNANAKGFPATTSLYGSVADGPHIDSKVKRRIGNDDRLWFAASVNTFPSNTAIEVGNLDVFGRLDYRLFGSLRKAKNRSAF